MAASAPAAQAAFGVEEHNFEAGTCKTASCTYASVEANRGEAYTQAAGHPPYGITGFELNHHSAGLGAQEPEGSLKRVRVDIPPGLAADPQALPQCSDEAFNKNACPANTKVGTNELVVFASLANATIDGTVYNLEPKPGLPLDFGIDVSVEPLVNVHIFLEGHVSWNTDYHEYFEINNIPKEGEALGLKIPLAVLKSKLIFNGHAPEEAGNGNFLTLPSVCSSTTTSHLEVESYAGEISRTETHTPVGVEGCSNVPFKPTAEVKPETAQSDEPDGAITEVRAPQNTGENEINTSDIRDAHVTLPEGMTLDPSAAHGLQVCTPAQIAIGTRERVTCPEASKVGTVSIETDLPPGSLAGNVYLGDPAGGPITAPPYTIYIDAESVYDVSVRLKGTVTPNPSTGRLEAAFLENPPLPFSDLILKLDGGARAPLANPLICGNSQVDALFTPYTGGPSALSATPFATTGCASPLPFSLKQSTQSSSAAAHAYTSYTFNLARENGQQYLSQVKTVLPAGLVGAIPSVPLCGEAQAQAGSCSAASAIGTATVSAGAGSEPYSFSGSVYLTGPYNGAPYGFSIPVRALAGPFDLGTVVTRASIGVDPHSGRVIVTSALPTIVAGIPLRLRTISVAVTRPSFLFNPTNCSPLTTDTTLTSTFGAIQPVSSAFQASGCSALPFAPKLTASTNAKTSKADGAIFVVKVGYPPGAQANIKSVYVALPKQLPSRISTLNKACPAATFEANPAACPALSRVGTATVSTPVLPGKLTGPAMFVSHGGAAFPDLDLVLSGDGGVTVILVGNTNIAKGITSSTYASVPDVPVSSFEVRLPRNPDSVLGAVGSLCKKSLVMPTTITAQNGKVLKQNTKIAVGDCPIVVLSHRVRGHEAILVVKVPGAGRVSAGGKDLLARHKRPGKARDLTIAVPLSRGGVGVLAGSPRHRLAVKVRLGFVPKAKKSPKSSASATVVFK
ncbi:MAG: hypothetical protein WB998_08055 [Solirubrobacteraceae bacterium]